MIKKLLLLTPIFLLLLFSCRNVEKHYEPTWESLDSHPLPNWYQDAKFGIFIHWGVYSVPGYKSEWYAHLMHDPEWDIYKYHREQYGDTTEFEYHEFVTDFKAEKWDPEEWAELFRKAGARYVVLTAEHHDGFPLWDCKYTEWDAVDKGPHRNLVEDLQKEVTEKGMKFSGSYHALCNYYKWPDWPANISGKKPGHKFGEKDPDYFEYMRNKLYELINEYHPDILWLDGDWIASDDDYNTKEVVAYYYNQAQKWGKEVVVNDRLGKVRRKHGDFFTPEREKMDTIVEHKWETCTSIDPYSWGYSRATKEEEYKSADEIIDMLVDIVSKNGNLLLNVGPKADGTIPQIMKDRLLETGKWLNINGEAIYGTRHWKVSQEGDIRFTKKGDSLLYAIVLSWPGEILTIKTIRDMEESRIKSVKMLGIKDELEWNLTDAGLNIQVPDKKPCEHAFAFCIEMK